MIKKLKNLFKPKTVDQELSENLEKAVKVLTKQNEAYKTHLKNIFRMNNLQEIKAYIYTDTDVDVQ